MRETGNDQDPLGAIKPAQKHARRLRKSAPVGTNFICLR